MTDHQNNSLQDAIWPDLVRNLLRHAVRDQGYVETDYAKYTISKHVSDYLHPLKVSVELPLRRKGVGIDKENIVLPGREGSAYERETAAFDRMLPELLKSSKGKFVAIRNQEIIDEDDNEFALARRIELSYRGKFVLIRQVLPSRPAYDLLESPEWEKA